MKEKERYFICSECGEMKLWSEILRECEEMGSNGLCDCLFMSWEWNEDSQSVDVWFPREYRDYTELSKENYESIKQEYNNVQRLKMLRCIPQDRLK